MDEALLKRNYATETSTHAENGKKEASTVPYKVSPQTGTEVAPQKRTEAEMETATHAQLKKAALGKGPLISATHPKVYHTLANTY